MKNTSNPRSELRNDLQALFNFESPEQSIKRLVTLVFHNRYGGIAQLGEHLLCKQGVIGSIPIISTNRGPIAQLVRAHD